MLTVKPWRDLMLPSVAHEMQFELLRMHKTEDKSNPVHTCFLVCSEQLLQVVVAIKDIFSRADVDGDGVSISVTFDYASLRRLYCCRQSISLNLRLSLSRQPLRGCCRYFRPSTPPAVLLLNWIFGLNLHMCAAGAV